MILAAGLGTRLRPLTYEIPKPAIPVLGRPIISYTIEFLAHNGISELVVNLHRVPGLIKGNIRSWGKFKGNIQYIIEPEILGTGGGIKNAQSALEGEEMFVIANSDTILDFDLKMAVEAHSVRAPLATMVLFPLKDEPYTPIYIDGEGTIVSIGSEPEQFETAGYYTGVSILSPRIFSYLKEGRSCIVRDGFQRVLERGEPLAGIMLEGTFLEFGTPKDYLRNTLSLLSSLGGNHTHPIENAMMIPPVYIGEGSRIGENAKIGPLVSIEPGAIVGESAVIAHSILWGKSRVEAGLQVKNSIVTPRRILQCPL